MTDIQASPAKRLRVVFMGTPEFSVPALEAIHSAHEVVCVYTQPDKPVGRGLELRQSAVKKKALALGLPIRQPERLSQEGEFESLRAFAPDVIVVVAYGQILRRNVLELPRLGCVNIHSSLLPRWRGAAPIQWAILAGDEESGVTTMKLVEKLDAGDILIQEKTPLSANDTAESLHDRLARIGAEIILPTLQGLDSGRLKGTPQVESQVTYAGKLTKEMETLDVSRSALELDRRVRALNPWPGTSVMVDGQRLKIKRARLQLERKGREGQIYEWMGMILLGTREGALELLLLQWEGKKDVDRAGFMNGLRGKGTTLPLAVNRSAGNA